MGLYSSGTTEAGFLDNRVSAWKTTMANSASKNDKQLRDQCFANSFVKLSEKANRTNATKSQAH